MATDNISTFLKLLPLEIEETTDYTDPGYELEPEDHVVGVMSDYLKKLYTVMVAKDGTMKALLAKIEFLDTEEELKETITRLNEMKSKRSAIADVFWICLKDEFSLWGKNDVGVRTGFEVVWTDSPMRRMLGGFFGGLGRL